MGIEQAIIDLLSAMPTFDIFSAIDPLALQPYINNRRSGRVKQVANVPSVSQTKGVAVVGVHGIMVRDAFWGDDVSMTKLGETCDQLSVDESVSAVVLDIDSPGGTASGMHDLHQKAIHLANSKPLYAHVSDYACSAAYYLASAAHEIYGSPRTTVGSIGTRMLLYDMSEMFSNFGIEAVTIDTGEFKSLGVLGAKISQSHRDHLQHLVDLYQQDFATAVKSGRGFTDEQYSAIADGRVFLAEEAVPLGLLDGVQSLAQTIEAVAAVIAGQAVTQRSKRMSTDTNAVTQDTGPIEATLAEMKDNLPGASSDFMVEQLEKKATLQAAMKAYFALQQANMETLAKEKTDAEAKADAAEKKAEEPTDPTAKKKGNPSLQKNTNAGEIDEDVDYRQMAMDYKKEHGCRWSEACLAIKKRHPASRETFGAPPVK